MLKFRDINHVRVSPRSFTLVKDGATLRIRWIPTFHFTQFYGMVKESAIANGYEVPSVEVVENAVCAQTPSECVSDGTARRPSSIPPRQGCKSCGRR